jgi:PAS domain S-box-containing protein
MKSVSAQARRLAADLDLTESTESEARYRGLLEAAPDAMVVVNGAGEIVLLNVQAETQFGYRRDELVGQKVKNIIPEGFAERLIADDLRSTEAALAQVIGTGIELVARRKDGTEFPIEIMLSPLQGAEGILVTAAIRDISARKAAEEELRRSSAFLENLIDYANAPIIVWDPDLRITRFNHAFERLTQRSAHEVVGRTLDLLFPDASRGPSLERIGVAVQGKALESDEIPILRADGHVRTVLWSSANIYDTASGGTLLAVIAQGQDITESTESEARYRGLLEAAPDAMVVVNGAGEIVLLNVQAETQFGYRRDELVGQKVKNIIPEGFAERLIADDLRSTEAALAQVIGTGIELVARRKDGTEFPIEIMLSPLQGAEGILVTAAIRDISARKAAEEELLQMEGRYRGLLEAAPDAMVVVNGAGEIVLLNLQTEKQFGYHRDELVGQKVTNIIPEGFAERLVADDLRSAADALAQQIGTGIELVGRRKDGTEFPIEIMLSPLESAEGILVTAAIRNISVRKIP